VTICSALASLLHDPNAAGKHHRADLHGVQAEADDVTFE
jgi:hypothetical protein